MAMLSDKPRPALLWLGSVILVLGLSAAGWVWYDQDRIDRQNEAIQTDESGAPLAPLDSRKHVRDVQLYYGNLGVLMEKAEGLLHGKPLAKTIAVASAMTAAGLFMIASRFPRHPHA
jgi:hypothetical protein